MKQHLTSKENINKVIDTLHLLCMIYMNEHLLQPLKLGTFWKLPKMVWCTYRFIIYVDLFNMDLRSKLQDYSKYDHVAS